MEPIERRGDPAAAPGLVAASGREWHDDLRIRMLGAALGLGSPDAIGPLIGMLEAHGFEPHWRQHAHHLLEVHLEEPVEDPVKLRAWYERHRGRLVAKGREFVPGP